MGINFILPIITGIVMMVVLGTKVAPSIVEQMKITKIENKTIANQDLIKEAIVRYIKTNLKVPQDLEEIIQSGLLNANHVNNLFEGGYSFDINVKNNTLKIYTTIEDEGASRYFKNSLKFANAPVCEQVDNKFNCETFYLLDNEVFDIIHTPLKKFEIGTIEDIRNRFTEDNLGSKEDKDGNFTIIDIGEKDYVFQDNEDDTYTIIEKEKQLDGSFIETNQIVFNKNQVGRDSGVSIKDLTWSFVDGLGNTINQQHEKVFCNDINLGNETFIVNENSGIGEVIWVAPRTNNMDDILAIKNKIFNTNIVYQEEENPFDEEGNFKEDWKPFNSEEVFGVKHDAIFKPNNICMSNVTSTKSLFQYTDDFNQPLDRWDTINIENMEEMFSDTDSFNKSLNSWDVRNVVNVKNMFNWTYGFDQPLDKWNTSKFTNISYMFSNAYEFNQPLNNWNVSNVVNMSNMFYSAISFNQPLNNWNVSNVVNMNNMFDGAISFNQPLNNWNVSNVKNMRYVFSDASAFNQPLNYWDVSNVKEMNSMFSGAKKFNQNINSWNVSNVYDMQLMFESAHEFNQPLNTWNTSKVQDMGNMFSNAYEFNQPLNNWKTSNVQSVSGMFYNAKKFNQNISNWSMSRVSSYYEFRTGSALQTSNAPKRGAQQL